MKKIIYYVAQSVDGFIAGKNDDVTAFIHQGKSIEKYQNDLSQFKTVIMGRKTYEFGYQFGLMPGQPAYPGMEHHIFSNSLKFQNSHSAVHIEQLNVDRVLELKQKSPSDIYLCGGGQFAGWLLDHHFIDQIKLKLNPIILGIGTPLFGNSQTKYSLKYENCERFKDGLQILTYSVQYQ